jgi:hypothetical protein
MASQNEASFAQSSTTAKARQSLWLLQEIGYLVLGLSRRPQAALTTSAGLSLSSAFVLIPHNGKSQIGNQLNM